MYKDACIYGDYRYWLSRYWDDNKDVVGWIMLNPSTADHRKDDPTIRRCIGYAKDWGYGGIMVVNLFAFRTSSPKDLLKAEYPISGNSGDWKGKQNDYWLKTSTAHCKIIIAAWGGNGSYLNRGQQVIEMFPDLMYLKLNSDKQPAHPLYLKGDLKPKRLNIANSANKTMHRTSR